MIYTTIEMYLIVIAVLFAVCRSTSCNNEPLKATTVKKYLIYDVNPGEGFNLRRDVYMRAANLVRRLRQNEPWILVLPPWPHLHHWRSNYLQENIPWRMFFDLDSLSEHVPCMEYEDFLTEYGYKIDRILYLQQYAEGWTSETWEDKIDPRDCIEEAPYVRDNNHWKRSYGAIFPELRSKEFQCMSVQGFASIMTSQLLGRSSERYINSTEGVQHACKDLVCHCQKSMDKNQCYYLVFYKLYNCISAVESVGDHKILYKKITVSV